MKVPSRHSTALSGRALLRMLPHERLEAYWFAEEYVAFIDHLLPRIRRASKTDAGQIDRCGGSILFNFIEASGDTAPGDKARYFRYSRREVSESYGILWRQYRKTVLTAAELRIARYYADRLSAMIWGLMKRCARSEGVERAPGR